jgi:hypothetical protein
MQSRRGRRKCKMKELACPHSESLTGVFKFNCLEGICFSKAIPNGSFVYLSIDRVKLDIELHGDNKRAYRKMQGFCTH